MLTPDESIPVMGRVCLWVLWGNHHFWTPYYFKITMGLTSYVYASGMETLQLPSGVPGYLLDDPSAVQRHIASIRLPCEMRLFYLRNACRVASSSTVAWPARFQSQHESVNQILLRLEVWN